VPNRAQRLNDRAGHALRRGLFGGSSPASMLATLGIALGTALLALQAAVGGLWFAAAGIVLIGVALLVMSVKVHKSASMTARLQRQLRDGFRGIGSGVPAAPRPAGILPPAAVADRLKAIGKVVPQVVDATAKGRQAAAVHADPQRSFRLYAATRGTVAQDPAANDGPGSRTGDATAPDGRRVAALVSGPLAASLATEFAVTRLHPGLAEAEFEASQPTALVIEEKALQQGAWYSTLQATGVGLLREVFALMSTARSRGISIYVVPSERLELSTTTLRRHASMVVGPGTDIADQDLRDAGSAPDSAVRRPLIDLLRRGAAPTTTQDAAPTHASKEATI
jgi:hypothetical protein